MSGGHAFLEQFGGPHADLLAKAFEGHEWRQAVDEGLVEAARRDMVTPPETEGVFDLPVRQLLEINEPSTRKLMATGERDEERLLATLGKWPEVWPTDLPVRLSFIGINTGYECDMRPRCLYCNQQPVEQRLGADDWARLVTEAIAPDGKGPYVYITGGEPLLMGEDLWGRDGLIRSVTLAGAACNLNTNALSLTPGVALGLVTSGLGRVHISLDTHRPETQDALQQRGGCWQQAIAGLHNLQIAKAVLGAKHPVIHLNCVLTRLNADDFPDFLRFVLGMKPRPNGGGSPDLDMHVIPVGGGGNRHLRLTAEGYERFFSETWAAADAVWQQHQAERDVPIAERRALHESVPFMSPYHRVEHRGGLTDWAVRAADGRPAALSLRERCYVAPTQAFVLPDGSQYWCGGHTVSRPEVVGTTLSRSIAENIRCSVRQMAEVPSASCQSCAGATQAINQIVEGRLRDTIRGWLNPSEGATDAQPREEPPVE